ncbi:SDR family NAD(P)-dependent oxidoreductase [Streptomyces pseudogriseolus]|uniref:SDR family NAD(P)-dependent oxidoreductase n=1 Tax=Streptomyces pseudogriseolus TaxID=36817 RepID=UPI003492EA30
MSPTTWFVTGASSGLGHALAEHVLEQGHRVVATAPVVAPLAGLADRHPEQCLVLQLDVTEGRRCADAVREAEEWSGGIDVLVNNAGIDLVGALEEQQESDYRAVFEVNFFGAVTLTRAVLPAMRARRRGTIVNISSMDGLASLPGNGFHSASKFALEGFTEALWQEVEPLGLHALLIEPGSFRTGIETRTRASGEPIGDYAVTAGAFRAIMHKVTPGMFPGDPARAAAVIFEEALSPAPRHRVILGSDAQRRIGVKLDQLREEYEAGKDVALSTDFPGSGEYAML